MVPFRTEMSFPLSMWGGERAQAGREVSQDGGLPFDLETPDGVAHAVALDDRLHDIIDVALGVHPSRDGQPDELHVRGRRGPGGHCRALPEHQGADLDATYAGLEIELARQGLCRQVGSIDMR